MIDDHVCPYHILLLTCDSSCALVVLPHTNTCRLLDDARYRGVKTKRLSSIDRPAYDAFMDEFMTAVRSFDHVSLQVRNNIIYNLSQF
jgi:hypothetical protein